MSRRTSIFVEFVVSFIAPVLVVVIIARGNAIGPVQIEFLDIASVRTRAARDFLVGTQSLTGSDRSPIAGAAAIKRRAQRFNEAADWLQVASVRYAHGAGPATDLQPGTELYSVRVTPESTDDIMRVRAAGLTGEFVTVPTGFFQEIRRGAVGPIPLIALFFGVLPSMGLTGLTWLRQRKVDSKIIEEQERQLRDLYSRETRLEQGVASLRASLSVAEAQYEELFDDYDALDHRQQVAQTEAAAVSQEVAAVSREKVSLENELRDIREEIKDVDRRRGRANSGRNDWAHLIAQCFRGDCVPGFIQDLADVRRAEKGRFGTVLRGVMDIEYRDNRGEARPIRGIRQSVFDQHAPMAYRVYFTQKGGRKHFLRLGKKDDQDTDIANVLPARLRQLPDDDPPASA